MAVGAGQVRPDLAYPLSEHRERVHTATGLPVSEITLDGIVAGRVEPGDVRIGAEALRLQAGFAEAGGNPQLAENLRRGAELAAFSDDELLRFYETLRPGRATATEMDELATTLAARGAERCAALVHEARVAYQRRRLLR